MSQNIFLINLQFAKEIDLNKHQPSNPGNCQADNKPEAAV